MSDKAFKPYVPDNTKYKDFSIRAVFIGVIFGALFGGGNAYLGLKAGLTVGTAIPLAVISVALFSVLQRKGKKIGILEPNITQTTGSASSSLASGVIFTIPAIYLWVLEGNFSFQEGQQYVSVFQVTFLAMLGGILGVLFMIPLRKFLIVKEHAVLPYPEGIAASEVLKASDTGGSKALFVFIGLGVGALAKFLTKFVGLVKEYVIYPIPQLKSGTISSEISSALLGVGYILGPRIAGIMVAGGLIAAAGVVPLISYLGLSLGVPEFISADQNGTLLRLINDNYTKYIGAGAVAGAGIITVIKSLPTMYEAFKGGIKGFKSIGNSSDGKTKRTETEFPYSLVLIGLLSVIAIIVFVPGLLGPSSDVVSQDGTILSSTVPFIQRIVAGLIIGIFAFSFVTVSSRIVGLVGVSSNPTSGMTIATLLGTAMIFFLLGWTDTVSKITALTVGTVVCVSASIAGDTSQDLKCGFLIGATPRKQQIAELIGVVFSALAIAWVVIFLSEQFGYARIGNNPPELNAPQATIMKTVIDGVLGGNMPWTLILIGAVFAVMGELVGIPSLAFAVGLYLPLAVSTPIFIGGAIRHFLTSSKKVSESVLNTRKDNGILFGAGLIAGEGLMGIAIGIYLAIAGIKSKDLGFGISWSEPLNGILPMVFLGLIATALIKVAISRKKSNT